MKSRLKIIISLAVIILVILLFIVAILIYRALYDISDLTLYENEKIQSIVKYGDQKTGDGSLSPDGQITCVRRETVVCLN